jgi:hypothetical protein
VPQALKYRRFSLLRNTLIFKKGPVASESFCSKIALPMKKKLIAFIPLLAAAICTFAQDIPVSNLKKHIETLASPEFEGRGTGEKGEKKAYKYLSAELKKMGVKPFPANKKSYLQPFEFELKLMDPNNPHGEMVSKGNIKGSNVVAWIDNAAQYTVVIGAHYDHLGTGGLGGSREAEPEGKIHYGADDNASGVAGALELARYLQNNGRIEEHNYLFIFFSGEEEGLFGSKFYVENPFVPAENINYMINMDMIGRLDSSTRRLVVHGVGTSPEFGTHLNAANNRSLSLVFDSSGVGPTDFTSFYRKNIPVLGFFTGQHNDYHKETDVPSRINYAGEKDVLEFIAALIDRLDTLPKQQFQKTREMQMGRTRFKVTLGIMPDYTYPGPGIRVDGVTDGKPAYEAGIQAGDIVLSLADTEITDMGSYMKLLGELEPGRETFVVIKRGEEELKLPVKF